MSSCLYLYGFVSAETALPSGSLTGIDDRPVRVLELGTVSAVVSDVDAERYAEESLERLLKDLNWVARRGGEHETVVTWLSDVANVVPARLLTVFSTEQALSRVVEERRDQIVAQLERLDGLKEWDVKVHYDMDVLVGRLGEVSRKIADADAEISRAAPGRRYLLERKREDTVKDEAQHAARALAREFLQALRSFAAEVRDLEIPSRGDGVPVVLHAAMLVPSERAEALQARAGELLPDLEDRGIRVAFTGPWAPYRFVEAGGSDRV